MNSHKMKKLKFKDLTEEEIQKISNGCGPMVRFLRLPQFIFEADCRRHDFGYWRGGNLRDKMEEDLQFYAYMLIDVAKQPKLLHMVFYFLMATIYFIFVAVFGHFFFNYGIQKTKKDLKSV